MQKSSRFLFLWKRHRKHVGVYIVRIAVCCGGYFQSQHVNCTPFKKYTLLPPRRGKSYGYMLYNALKPKLLAEKIFALKLFVTKIYQSKILYNNFRHFVRRYI